MFSTSFSDFRWDQLGQIGQRWQLVCFPEKAPPTWESYWAEERKYWGADAANKSRVRLYFGETNTEQNLLNESKNKFEKFKEYLLHWNGLCRVGEVVQVIPLEPTVIALSQNWSGQISDHSDLEIWLKEEKTFFRKHVRFCCEIYSFGTRVVPKGSIEEEMGEPVGSWRIAHRHPLGSSKDRNESVTFEKAESVIVIGDAHFRIVG